LNYSEAKKYLEKIKDNLHIESFEEAIDEVIKNADKFIEDSIEK
jgi:hypothetical protein